MEQKCEILPGNGSCNSYKKGVLPECAPLALAYVPMQESARPAYDAGEALQRGTLFPGLDLPFMNLVNNNPELAGTPLGEVMALCFASHELRLYLDTHPGDEEAFDTLRQMLKLTAEAKRRYTARFGPLTPTDLAESEHFDWLDGPWPWQYQD